MKARLSLHTLYRAVGEWTHTSISSATRAKTNPNETIDRLVLRLERVDNRVMERARIRARP
jgi:hypothetical protein